MREPTIMDYASAYYMHIYKDNNTSEPALYLKERVFLPKTVQDFGLGVSPNSNGLMAYLYKKGFSLDDMRDAGLVRQYDNMYYDCMCRRVIITIRNTNGEVVGFAGRKVGDIGENDIKYINTKTTKQFAKSKTVFNLDKVKYNIDYGGNDYVILVEGYFDVISLWDNGIKNAVCSMGTALTDSQAKIIKTFTNNVVLCYDGDEAGQKATQRAVEILETNGMNAYPINLPNGDDVDEYLKDFNEIKFLNLVNETINKKNVAIA